MFFVTWEMLHHYYSELEESDTDELLTLLGSEYVQQDASPPVVGNRTQQILSLLKEQNPVINLDEFLLEMIEISNEYNLQNCSSVFAAMIKSPHAKALANEDLDHIIEHLHHENIIHQYTSRMLVNALSNERLRERMEPTPQEISNLINRLFVITTGDNDAAYSETEASELCFQFSVKWGLDEEATLRPFYQRACLKKSGHTIKELSHVVRENTEYTFFAGDD